jgi:CHAT domain-containing protein
LRRAVQGKSIVHFATHGFAFSDSCDRPRPGLRGIGGLSIDTHFTAVDDQLFSGLVLAGANNRAGASRSDEDGILTEDEIFDLDLRSASWVVLSACGSGLGSIRPGEGVLGMRRAFQVAGAKSVIVSLWSVNDQASRNWMRELYKARFERNLPTVYAVRQATLRSLQVSRKSGDDNPAKWAGFVASGNWK